MPVLPVSFAFALICGVQSMLTSVVGAPATPAALLRHLDSEIPNGTSVIWIIMSQSLL